MKFDLQIETDQDIDYFKTLFYRNIGAEQNIFDFVANDTRLRIQISAIDGGQQISIGIFSIIKEGKSTTINQICPLADSRFASFQIMQSIWHYSTEASWGVFTHGQSYPGEAFETLKEILCVFYHVNKVKASA